MGNHHAGRAMGRAAVLALKMRTTQTALELLDEICLPYKGCDAEFEAENPKRPGHQHPDYIFYTDPEGPLGKLIIEAFGGGRDWAGELKRASNEEFEALNEEWQEGPLAEFDKRYEFC